MEACLEAATATAVAEAVAAKEGERAEVVSTQPAVLEAAAAEGRMAEAAVPQVEEAAAASARWGR